MDQKTFWREQAPPKTKSYITWGILGGMFLCVNALMSTSLYGALALLVVALLAGLTLGVYIKQSRVCALALLVLFVGSNAIVSFFVPIDVWGVILIAVVGYALVCGMLGTFAFQREWRMFRDQKTLPPEQ